MSDVAGLIQRLRVLERMGLLKTPVDAIYGEAATALQTLTDKIEVQTRLLLQCAPSFQGGHSEVGYALSEALGVGFPLSMPSLRAEATKRGFMPYDLWPWLERMERGRAALTKEGKSA